MKVGFTCGVFDFCHAGHVLMFKECKKVCDYLIVGIKVDPTVDKPGKSKPVQSIVERQIQVQACRYVDEIIVYETEKDLVDILSVLDIDIRIMGADHEGRPTSEGREVCRKRGIKFFYNKRGHRFSSTELKRRIKR